MLEVARDVNDERANRFVAALFLADTTGGAVADVAIVEVLSPLPEFRGECIGAVLIHAEDARRAIRAIRKNGKTDAVRAGCGQGPGGPRRRQRGERRGVSSDRAVICNKGLGIRDSPGFPQTRDPFHRKAANREGALCSPGQEYDASCMFTTRS